MTTATESTSLGRKVLDYFKGFAVLKETRKEYWGLQAINFLDMTAYFSLYGIVVVLLSEDFGFSDIHAGYIFTAFTLGTTICLWFSGLFTDWLGIRRTIYLSMAALLGTRLVLILAGLQETLPYRGYVAAGAIILMAPGMAMVQTMLQAANRRFTTARSRGPGFNLWYLFMNVGAACGGFIIDLVRKNLGLPNTYILFFSIFSAVACVVIAFFVIRCEEQLYGPGEVPDEKPRERKKPWQIAWSVVSHPVFWRFMVLVVLLLGVRAVFLYLHLLYPKFWLRVIGPEAAIGTLQAINPILVIIGLILLVPILHRFSVYAMLTYGAIISALSMFVMAVPSYGQTTYTITLLSLIVLTVGEIIWSPRLQEYTAAIAPKGQEGTYLGLSLFPWFFAKGAVSFLSGHMLARWIPEFPEGEPLLRDRLAAGQVAFWQSPSALFIILGIVALAGPVIALAMRRRFTKGASWNREEADREIEARRKREAQQNGEAVS
jgi:POT family proton-dependent oligopeptide transporter